MEQEFQSAPGTQTIDRAAQLLTLVLEAERPRALTELADDAALPKSTASRLLGALERQGLIQQRGPPRQLRARAGHAPLRPPRAARRAGAAAPGGALAGERGDDQPR